MVPNHVRYQTALRPGTARDRSYPHRDASCQQPGRQSARDLTRCSILPAPGGEWNPQSEVHEEAAFLDRAGADIGHDACEHPERGFSAGTRSPVIVELEDRASRDAKK